MKVLQFIPSLSASDGGTTTYMQQLAPVLGVKCELHVCCRSTVDAVPLSHCQVHTITHSMLHYGRMRSEWMQLLNTIHPDVVHVNCCWMPQIACVIQWTHRWRDQLSRDTQGSSDRSHHLPSIVLTPHGMLEPWIIARHYWTKKVPAIWLYQRRVVQLCDLIISTADEERDHLMSLGWNPHVAMVRNGIDVHAIDPKQSWHEPRSILFMSRIHPKKGLEILLDAMAYMSQACPLMLTVAGMGEPSYIEQLQRRVQSLEIDDRVHFVGPVFGSEKWRLLHSADAVVLPSYSENYGLIVAEALACGTPVITTTGTPWKSVDETGSGWWVEPTVDAVANALKELSKLSCEEVGKMSINARNLALRDCDISAKVDDLYHLYLSISN